MEKGKRSKTDEKKLVDAKNIDLKNSDFRQVFMGEGAEPLCECVIQESVSKGWPENDLRQMQKEGAFYSRPRNSILFPPEFS
jgi:hypothetical protein